MHNDVKVFALKFGHIVGEKPGHLTRRKLAERIACMQEELDEFSAAADNCDLAGQADALVDLVYFALGTSVMLGLPWLELWDDVQRANMAKERGVGKRGFLVDCIKPHGWKGPKTEEILSCAGYNPDEPSPERDDAVHKDVGDA